MCREPPRAGGRSCARVLCIAISDDRGDESSADDLNMGRGIVSGRVALLLRSTEIRPPVPTICPAPPFSVSFVFRFGIFAFVSFRFGFELFQFENVCFCFFFFLFFFFFEVFRWVEGLAVADAPGRPARFFFFFFFGLFVCFPCGGLSFVLFGLLLSVGRRVDVFRGSRPRVGTPRRGRRGSRESAGSRESRARRAGRSRGSRDSAPRESAGSRESRARPRTPGLRARRAGGSRGETRRKKEKKKEKKKAKVDAAPGLPGRSPIPVLFRPKGA